MINRRITRCVLNTTEVTATYSTPDQTQNSFNLTTTDAFYIGFHAPFASRYIQIHTANNVASELTIQYWNGAWVDVEDLLDQTQVGTVTLAQNGFVSWVNKSDWKAHTITGVDQELFWVKLTVSANLTGGTKVHAILNLFSDDNLLRAYFPEIVTDTNYLPTGKTNFIQQHMAAKDLVVLRLKQRKLINDESQVIDVNDVAVASVYAAAMLILQPIATSDASKDILTMATKGFNDEIAKVTFAVDQDSDGIVDETERSQSFSVGVFRR